MSTSLVLAALQFPVPATRGTLPTPPEATKVPSGLNVQLPVVVSPVSAGTQAPTKGGDAAWRARWGVQPQSRSAGSRGRSRIVFVPRTASLPPAVTPLLWTIGAW